jgi:hypothetical protein
LTYTSAQTWKPIYPDIGLKTGHARISRVHRATRILILALLLAALPLRGYAGVVADLCESHSSHGPSVEGHVHEEGASHDHGDSGVADEPSPAASVCSHCAACCASAALAAEPNHGRFLQPPASDRIPFRKRLMRAFHPSHLERPPLAS